MSDTTTPEYRTGFDEAPSTFNQEDAAPADYPPLPTNADLGFLADDIREEPVTWSLICDLVRKAIAADRTQRSGVSADPLPRPLLTDLEIQGLRRQARNDPRCADQHWFILMVRAIESYYGVTGAAAQSQPLVEPTADRIIEVFYQDGEDPLICAVQGNFTVEVLAEIERDLKANDGDYFAKGDGTYRFECSHFPGQYGFEGRCEIAPGWELDELSFAVFPEQHQVKKGEPS